MVPWGNTDRGSFGVYGVPGINPPAERLHLVREFLPRGSSFLCPNRPPSSNFPSFRAETRITFSQGPHTFILSNGLVGHQCYIHTCRSIGLGRRKEEISDLIVAKFDPINPPPRWEDTPGYLSCGGEISGGLALTTEICHGGV